MHSDGAQQDGLDCDTINQYFDSHDGAEMDAPMSENVRTLLQRLQHVHGRSSLQSPTTQEETPQITKLKRSTSLVPNQTLDLSGQNLTKLPQDFDMDPYFMPDESGKQHMHYTELLLSGNQLRHFPDGLHLIFPNLERLALGSNSLSEIPDEIGELHELTWLDFTHNRIGRVSDRLSQLKNLTSLGASDCRLSTFPVAFTRLRNLRKLGVFNNLLTSLPNDIGNMHSLTKLDLSGNQLRTLPNEIGNLVMLTWLNISNNSLEELPKTVNSLTLLRELGLAHNNLKVLPDLGNLRNLTLLTVFNNQLTYLGEWICDLPSLAKLDASGNRLRSLPKRILEAPSLDLLNVRSNQIVNIENPFHAPVHQFSNDSRTTVAQTRIKVLDVRDNLLNYIPSAVRSGALCELKVSGNLFPDIVDYDNWSQNYSSVSSSFTQHDDDSGVVFRRGNSVQCNHASQGDPKKSKKIDSQCLKTASLLESAASVVLRHTLHLPRGRAALLNVVPPSLQALALDVWAGRTGLWCSQCRGLFLGPTRTYFDYGVSTDGIKVPFLMRLCSKNCQDVLQSSKIQETLLYPQESFIIE